MIKMQIGKNGLSDEFIDSLKLAFKNTENIRIHLLKSSTRDRQEVKEIAEKIISELGEKGKYTHKIIGFTIALRKWRRARK